MDLQLAGRVVVVTGASAGIGAATARTLHAEGARLCLVARRTDRLTALADDLAGRGERPLVHAADVTDPTVAAELREAVMDRYGGVDGIVSAAGGSRFVSVDAGDDAWREAMALNFEAGRRITHALLDAMRGRAGGSIVNVTGSLEPRGLSAAHSAKAAVHAWAKGLSRELGPAGIRVNSVSPGRILTEQIARMHPTEQDRAAFAAAEIPLRRFGTAEEAATLIAFLLSPCSSYLTGEIIHLDGGMRRSAF